MSSLTKTIEGMHVTSSSYPEVAGTPTEWQKTKKLLSGPYSAEIQTEKS